MKITFGRESSDAFDVAWVQAVERVALRALDIVDRRLQALDQRGPASDEAPRPAARPSPAPVVATPAEAPPVDLAQCRDVLAEIVASARAHAGGDPLGCPAVEGFLALSDQGWADVDAYVQACGSLRKAVLAVWTTDGVAVAESQHTLDAVESEQLANTVLMSLFALGRPVPHYWARLSAARPELDLDSIGGPRGG